jgi:hypothetical protein
VDYHSIILILVIAKFFNLSLATTDVPAAYLNATLKERILMILQKDMSDIMVKAFPHLSSFLDKNGQLIVDLFRCLYGLKQASVGWFELVVETLKSIGYSQTLADACVFVKRVNEKINIIAIHVDDFLIATSSPKELELIKTCLSKFGELVYETKNFTFLGMHVEVMDDNSVSLDMSAMIRRIMTKHNVVTTSITPSNLELFNRLDDPTIDYSVNSTEFKSQLMELMFVSRVRVDIVKECTFLATLSNNPGPLAFAKLKKLQAYLNMTHDLNILLGADDLNFKIYVDAAYALHENSRSHTGILITLGDKGGPILVKSFVQKLVTNSSTEAELLALVDGVKKSFPILKLLEEITDNPIVMTAYQDNKSTILLAKGGEGLSGKSKHFRVRYHFLKELIDEGKLILTYVSTDAMVADVLTKPMSGENFAYYETQLQEQLLSIRYLVATRVCQYISIITVVK